MAGVRRPFFSVVIPVYNRAGEIGPTLRSVLSQTFQDFEIVVVDDGSVDGSCHAVEALHDPRILLIRQKNSGPQAARNAGIDAARGRYLAFLDSDDLFVEQKLSRVHDVAQSDGVDVVYSGFLVDRGVGRFMIRPERPLRPGEDVGEYLFVHGGRIQTSGMVVRTEMARRVRFSPGLRRGQDYDFALRLHRAGARAHFINEPLFVWNDKTRKNRVSLGPLRHHMEEWLANNAGLMTDRARLGYRASVLSYERGASRPLTAAADIVKGVVLAGIRPSTAGRLALRAYLPAPVYRGLITGFVALFGRPPQTYGGGHEGTGLSP